MTASVIRGEVDRLLSEANGVMRLEPAWVARDWLPPGRRLNLPPEAYDVGERGYLCERWLGSTTKADNRVGPPDEGLSYLVGEGSRRVQLKQAVDADPVSFLGSAYAATHRGLERLAKIFDYAARIPYHIHPTHRHASLVGRKPKDEAYYFPSGVDMGAHPESFFGVHPWIADGRRGDVLLPYLQDWNSDLILKHARAELLVAEEGFHIPSGTLHAPGTALTVELQEDSDVLAMFQALNAGTVISKDLLFKDVRPEDRERHGERFVLDFIDWELNGDPYFYEHRHLSPQPVDETRQPGGQEWWIFYNTTKFSGKKLVVRPGQSVTCRERGVYNILVWRGTGRYAGLDVRGGEPGMDELFVVHDAAIRPLPVQNTGSEDLVILKFFGPDINRVPMNPPYRPVTDPRRAGSTPGSSAVPE